MPPLQMQWPTGSGPVSYRPRAQPYASEEPRSLSYGLRIGRLPQQRARSAISFAAEQVEIAAACYIIAGCNRSISRNITLRLTGPQGSLGRIDQTGFAAPVQSVVRLSEATNHLRIPMLCDHPFEVHRPILYQP